MAEVGVAFVSVVPTARNFGKQLQSQTSPGAAAAGADGGKQFGGKFKGAVGSAMKGMAGVFAVGAVVKGIQSVVAEAREAEKVSAITENRIRTMGNAAGISATAIGKLADSIARKTGVDDEAIQSGANLLLTFKNVRQEVGKGNDIFSRATKIVTDLSREKGMGGLETNAIRLGKALNDPIKGISALSRVGVQFTGDQKKAIKEMVKSGDLLGAQKIILKELETQYGGTAEASATAGEKMSQAWGQVKEKLGTALLPLLNQLATMMIDHVIPALSKFADWMVAHPGAVKFFALAVAAVALALVAVFLAANALVILFGVLIALFVVFFVQLWGHIQVWRENIKAYLGGLWEEIKQEWMTAWNGIKTFFTAQFEEIKQEWMTAWNGIKTFFSTWWNEMKTEATTGATNVKTAASGHWEEMGQEWNTAWGTTKGLFKSWWTEMKEEANTGVTNVTNAAGKLKGKIQGKFAGANKWLENAGKDIMQGLIDGIEWGVGKVEAALSRLTAKLPSWKGPPSTDKKLLWENGQFIIGSLIGGMQSREQGVKSTLRGLTNTIGSTSPGVGSGFSPSNIVTTGGGAAGPSEADMRLQAKFNAEALAGSTFRFDNRGNLQLIAAGG